MKWSATLCLSAHVALPLAVPLAEPLPIAWGAMVSMWEELEKDELSVVWDVEFELMMRKRIANGSSK